jgi:hypothetical protein
MWSSDLEERIKDVLSREMEEAAQGLTGLEERVIRAIAERPSSLRLGRVRAWVRALVAQPRWAMAAGTALAMVVGIVIGHLLLPGPVPLAAASQGTLFAVVAPQASSVAVVGDFSAWEPVPLKEKDGVWTAVLKLPPGRYEYAFVVDGRWVGQDPLADEYVRSFGEYASVRYVGTGGGA